MHKYKCIFIHIPKNAGSSIVKTLGHKNGRSHAEWNHYFESNSRWFERYHKFSVCREPLNRLLSGYHYIINNGNHSAKDLALKKYIQKSSNNANEFIENIISHDFIIENILFRPQYLFVFNEREECMMDTILQFESLSEDWLVFANKHGLPKRLQSNNLGVNPVTENSGDSVIQQKNIEKIRSIYHKDYHLFNY